MYLGGKITKTRHFWTRKWWDFSYKISKCRLVQIVIPSKLRQYLPQGEMYWPLEQKGYPETDPQIFGTMICHRGGIAGGGRGIWRQYFFFLNGLTHGVWKFPGQGLNPSHICDFRCPCGNTGYFNPLYQAGNWTHTSTATLVVAAESLTHFTSLRQEIQRVLFVCFFFFGLPGPGIGSKPHSEQRWIL